MNYGETLTIKSAVVKRVQRVMILTRSLPQRSFILLCVLLLSTHRGALYSYYPQSSTSNVRKALCSYNSNDELLLLFATIVFTILVNSFVSHLILIVYILKTIKSLIIFLISLLSLQYKRFLFICMYLLMVLF